MSLSEILLRTDNRAFIAVAHLVPAYLARRLDGAFAREGIDWNGHKSCPMLSFDCDFPEDCLALPAVAEELDRRDLKASFACIGRWVEDYPEEHRTLVESSHEVFNHTYSHPELVNAPGRFVSFRSDLNERHWHELSLGEKREEIARCQRVVGDVLGFEMRGFRAPHFGKVDVDEIYDILAELGLSYSSSALASRSARLGLPVWRGDLLEIPVTTCPRHPWSSCDSWHAFYARDGWHGRDFGELLERRVADAVESNALTNIYLDPKDVGRFDFGRFLDRVAEEGECWRPTYTEFTAWYREAVGTTAMPAPSA